MNDKYMEGLYALAIIEPSPEAVNRLKVARIDWEEVAGMSFNFRSSTILYKNAARYGLIDKFKPETMSKLKAGYLSALARNVILKSAFFNIISFLNREDIKAAPLKGISLMLDTYFDEALRPMEDLDLFIHERDIGRVVTIFEKAGYDVNAAMRDIWKPNRNHAYVLFNSDTADVDLHNRLCP